MSLHSFAEFTAAPTPPNAIGPARALYAMRLAGLARSNEIDPQARLVDLFGGEAPARAFRVLLAVMAQIWPDPIRIFRPCCPRLTHDEAAVLTMLELAKGGNRHRFDVLLADMLDSDARDCLFAAAVRFTSSRDNLMDHRRAD